MSKKAFTILLLAVFMLVQFSNVSAAAATGTGTLTAPTFSQGGFAPINIDWAVSGLGIGTTYVDMYARIQGGTYAITECRQVAVIVGQSDASGTFTYNYAVAFPLDQQIWEFLLTFDDTGSCVTPPANAAVASNFMASTFIDSWWLGGFIANPPSLDVAFKVASFSQLPVACNTFELWGLVSDKALALFPAKTGFATLDGYSGFASWNQSVTGTFAPPAPLGPADALLSWVYTFPSTASGNWSFSVNPTDFAGNEWGTTYFRDALGISPGELADCASFSDTSGTDTEVYVRYMAQLDLAHGYLDGTFKPDSTLIRAEMAALIELANGITAADPLFGIPPAAGSACDFSDVSAADWFAGWVWQACADGYMNGLGNGLFGPNDLLTRGQVVTALNNVWIVGGGNGYLVAPNVLNGPWGILYREATFTDVPLGAFYAVPVQNAYGVGVAEGTSATTFSPDVPVTRGEFVKMMYRALSIIQSRCVACKQ